MPSSLDLTDIGVPVVILYITIFFLGIVHPIWSIVDCALSKAHSATSKVVWIVLMHFTSLLTSFFYGLFSARSRALRTCTIGSILVIILSVAALAAIAKYKAEQNPGKSTTKTQPKNSKPKNSDKAKIKESKKVSER